MTAKIHQFDPKQDGLTYVIYWVTGDKRLYYTGTKNGVYEFSKDQRNAKTYTTYAGTRRQKSSMHRKCGPAFQGTLWVASI